MKSLIKIFVISFLILFYAESLLKIGAIANTSMSDFELCKLKTSEYIKLSPESYQVYIFINTYCKLYDVPVKYAYRVASLETGWLNPFQLKYNAYRVSLTDALGPMQVLLSTAKDVWKDDSIMRNKLLYDIEFNIKTSIKYQQQLYSQYNDWKIVYSIYNSGYADLNDYAKTVTLN